MKTTASPQKGPYSLAGQGPIVIDGVERHPGQIMRENSGALVIMAPDPGGEEAASDRMRIGTVDLIEFKPKRGEGWKTTAEDDPVQWATAQLFMASPKLRDLLLQLREEVIDWQEALCGEREGLDELCAEIDTALGDLGVELPAPPAHLA